MPDKKLFFILIFLIISSKVFTQDTIQPEKSFLWNLRYTCDAGRNFTGGISKGNVYMGLVDAGVEINTDKAWKGGTFVIDLMNTHGGALSCDYVGDIQIISNIENGNYTFLEKLNFKQEFGKYTITAGLQDLCTEFCISEYGGYFTNSSFGIHSTFPLNFNVPIYPKTALALVGTYTASNKITLKASLWDGNAGSLDIDPHNTNWDITKEDGLLSVEEIEYRPISDKATSLKLGGIYHSGIFTNVEDTIGTVNSDIGIYAISDIEFFSKGQRSLGVFGQLAVFPSDANFDKIYAGAGLTANGLVKRRTDDWLAIGVAYARLFDNSYECDIECNYSYEINSHFSVQPTFHYIIHPGANIGLNNAYAAFLRLSLSL